MALAAVLLLGTYVVPLWRIQLYAPQYPEGLGMLIKVNTIVGAKPEDLNSINALNHYIGMKVIEPAAFPVLKVMPWVVGALAFGSVLAAATGVRALVWGWLVAFAVAGAAGMAEFFRWSYDYGHDLSPDAIIKVPGMSYQPPLIGSKQLLNFTAQSWPATGTWLAIGAFALGVVALLWRTRPARTLRLAAVRDAVASRVAASLLALVLVASSACHPSDPVPIAYGHAECEFCRMLITDKRFGGEAITRTGKVYQFDSIECLANFIAETSADVRSVWVSDFDRPGTLIAASRAEFVRKPGPNAEMGAGLFAVSRQSGTASVSDRFGARALSWEEIKALAARHELRPLGAPAVGTENGA